VFIVLFEIKLININYEFVVNVVFVQTMDISYLGVLSVFPKLVRSIRPLPSVIKHEQSSCRVQSKSWA